MVEVITDLAERTARGLPEKVGLDETVLGTEACYLSEAESRLFDATHALAKEAMELVNKTEKAEERSLQTAA